MSKAVEFIEKYTKDSTNQIINGTYGTVIPHFYPWLTPDQALRAVEIARDEMIEWLKENAYNYSTVGLYTDAMITDLKQAIKDE